MMAKRSFRNNDVIYSPASGGTVFGYGLGDTIYAGGGQTYIVALGNASIFCGVGNTYVSFVRGTNTVDTGSGTNNVIGGSGNDTFLYSLTQHLNSRGTGYYDGGAGFDTLRLSLTPAQNTTTLQKALADFNAQTNKNKVFDFSHYHIPGLNIKVVHVEQVSLQLPTVLNTPPTSIALSNSTVAEDAVGATIGKLSVSGLSSADTATLTLTDSSGSFMIDSSGNLKLKPGVSLDFEVQSNYNVSVKAAAAGGSITKSFTIHVTDVTGPIKATNDVLNQNGDLQATDGSGAITITSSRLLANDQNPDSDDVLKIVSVTNSAHGAKVSLNSAGNVAYYDPGSTFSSLSAGKQATDTFSYTVKSADGQTSTATVTEFR